MRLGPRRICHKENVALRHDDGSGRRWQIARDVQLLPQPWLRRPGRSGAQVPGGCPRTMPAHRANPRSPLESRRPGASRFLKQTLPDLLPGNHIRGACARAGQCGNRAQRVAHPSTMPSPLQGFPRRYRGAPPFPQGRGFLSGFADRSYAYHPSAVLRLMQAHNRGAMSLLDLTSQETRTWVSGSPAVLSDFKTLQ